LAVKVSEELADYAELLFLFDDFSAGSEGAEFGVDHDLFDERDFGDVFCVAPGPGGAGDAGQVDARDLKAIYRRRPARLESISLPAMRRRTSPMEDWMAERSSGRGRAVLGEGQVELGLAAATATQVFDWAAGGVVVVTKFFVAEACAAATTSVGEDVAALEASDFV
jgi:hypothetical protein